MNPYTILGLKPGAKIPQLKRAYRKLSMQYHPDRNNGSKEAEEAFKRIQHAYKTLNPKQDDGTAFNNKISDIDQTFAEYFAQTMVDSIPVPEPYTAEIQISFEDSRLGVEKKVGYYTKKQCPTCLGSKINSSYKKYICATCKGLLRVRVQLGHLTLEQDCPSCDTTGLNHECHCPTCNATGHVHTLEHEIVQIPAGIKNGMMFVSRLVSGGILTVLVNVEKDDW